MSRRKERVAKFLEEYRNASPLRKLEMALGKSGRRKIATSGDKVNYYGDLSDFLNHQISERDWKNGGIELWRDPEGGFSVPRPLETYSLKELKNLQSRYRDAVEANIPVTIKITEARYGRDKGLPIVLRNYPARFAIPQRIKYLEANDAYRAAKDAGFNHLDYFTLNPNDDIIFALQLDTIKDLEIPKGSILYPIEPPEITSRIYLDYNFVPLNEHPRYFEQIDWFKVGWEEELDGWERDYYSYIWWEDFPSQDLILDVPDNWDKPDLIWDRDESAFALSIFRAYEKGMWQPPAKRKWDIDKILRDFGGFKVDDKLYIGNHNLVKIGKGIKV